MDNAEVSEATQCVLPTVKRRTFLVTLFPALSPPQLTWLDYRVNWIWTQEVTQLVSGDLKWSRAKLKGLASRLGCVGKWFLWAGQYGQMPLFFPRRWSYSAGFKCDCLANASPAGWRVCFWILFHLTLFWLNRNGKEDNGTTFWEKRVETDDNHRVKSEVSGFHSPDLCVHSLGTIFGEKISFIRTIARKSLCLVSRKILWH